MPPRRLADIGSGGESLAFRNPTLRLIGLEPDRPAMVNRASHGASASAYLILKCTSNGLKQQLAQNPEKPPLPSRHGNLGRKSSQTVFIAMMKRGDNVSGETSFRFLS